MSIRTLQHMNFSPKISVIAAFSCWLAVAALSATSSGQQVELKPRSHDGKLVRVKTIVEVAGSLIVDPNRDSTSDKQPRFPMKVNAELLFDDRGLSKEDISIRHYWKSEVEIDVNESTDQRTLRDDRNLILLSGGTTGAERITSPLGPLNRAELDLIDVPGNVFAPEKLLTEESVETESTWTHDSPTTAELLRLEEVTSGDLVSEVTEVSDETVKISLKGEIEGKVDGVETSMEVVGNYHFDREAQIVKWLALAIREKRDVGFAAPGIEVTTRVRSARQVIPTSQPLSDDVLDGIVTNKLGDEHRLLEFVAPDDSFRMAIDRNWYVLSNRGPSSTLRMVENGNLIATCKIDPLPTMVPGKQVSLDGFRDDVQAALAKNCKKIVSVGQSVSPNGLRVMRVVAAGEVSDTPIHWIYCHLSDDHGRRLSCIFTLEASLEDPFAGKDESVTNSIEFIGTPERQASSSTEAVR